MSDDTTEIPEVHEVPETVDIPGTDGKIHIVPAAEADNFRNSSDGSFLTDEQWDETKRRLNADNTYLVPEEFR